MELREYLAVARRWLWLLIVGVVLSGAAAFALARHLPPAYSATSTILIDQAQSAAGPTYNDVLASQQLSATYSALITSPRVLGPVAQQLGLPVDLLLKTVRASERSGTQLIDITAHNANPALAARIADETATVFVQQMHQGQAAINTAAEKNLEAQIAAYQTSISEKQQSIQRLTNAQLGLNDNQLQEQLASSQLDLNSLLQAQAALNQQLGSLRVQAGQSAGSIIIANTARVPTRPASPSVKKDTALGILLGLIVVVSIIAVAEHLDDGIRSPEDVRRIADLATLGAITAFGHRAWRSDGNAKDVTSHLLPRQGGYTVVGEAYRMLRTSLEFGWTGQAGHSMLVTSALAGEGKSTTAVNLGIVLAQAGKRVLLVDADLRQPSLHRLFNLPNDSGFSLLFTEIDLARSTGLGLPTEYENLFVLPSGPPPFNPVELLSSPRMRQISRLLARPADVVIYDSPPILGVADASVLAAQVDGVVLVVDSARTQARAFRQAAEMLRQTQATVWGVVLNKLKLRPGSRYYSYSYAYNTSNREPKDLAVGMHTAAPVAAPTRGLIDLASSGWERVYRSRSKEGR